MANDFWLEEIPNYKELCFSKCPDDFDPKNVIADMQFTIQKFDDVWYAMKGETQVIVTMSAQVGLKRLNKQNAHEWLTRLAMLQGLHGHFLYDNVPVRALYVADAFIKEVHIMSTHRAIELSVGAQEQFTELEGLVVDKPKHVSLPRQLDPLVVIAHGGFKNNVEAKSFDEFCRELRLKAENMIDENIKHITEEQRKKDKNKKKRDRKKR